MVKYNIISCKMVFSTYDTVNGALKKGSRPITLKFVFFLYLQLANSSVPLIKEHLSELCMRHSLVNTINIIFSSNMRY